MNRSKPTHFRNSLNLRDKVQVKILRKRLKLTDEQFSSVLRKSGMSISALAKEAATLKSRTAATGMKIVFSPLSCDAIDCLFDCPSSSIATDASRFVGVSPTI